MTTSTTSGLDEYVTLREWSQNGQAFAALARVGEDGGTKYYVPAIQVTEPGRVGPLLEAAMERYSSDDRALASAKELLHTYFGLSRAAR